MEQLFITLLMCLMFSLTYKKDTPKQKILVHPDYWKYSRTKIANTYNYLNKEV